MTADLQKSKITVLMSTYNGEKYLTEQIESILNQRNVDINLLVRDDGSTDQTLTILKKYQEKGALEFYTGKNLGPQRSFLHLLQNAPQCDYYAFADQDDVWLEDKLYSGISQLENAKGKPALYFSQTQLTDENLRPIPSIIIHPKLTFGEMLVYKFIGGCTMILNHPLRKVIGTFIPVNMPMHDLWVYSIALAADAHVVFDPNSHILYRQHGNNTIGQGQGFIYEWTLRLKRFATKKNDRYSQAQELANGYLSIMSEKNATLLKLYLEGKQNWRKRLSLMTNKELRCADRITQILFWINVVCNKY